MLKRIWLFLATNLAIIILLSIVMFIIEYFFGIRLTWYSYIFVVALVIWIWGSTISLFMSKWSAKRAYKLQIIKAEDVYKLSSKEKLVWETVQSLAERNNIKMPELGIYTDKEANAFATWATKNSSLVAVSSGLLETMTEAEIEWVIGHEMAHILNWDMVTMALLQWVLNVFVIFAARVIWRAISAFVDEEWALIAYYVSAILLEFVFWLIASMIAMWFSRHREFRADEWSAKYLWKEKMISWLQALQRMQSIWKWEKDSFATMKISSNKKRGFMANLFSTHPDLEARIANLENKTF